MSDVKFLATAEEILATAESANRSEAEIGRRSDQTAGGKLTRISADKSERLTADRTGGNASSRVTPARGGMSSETADVGRVRAA